MKFIEFKEFLITKLLNFMGFLPRFFLMGENEISFFIISESVINTLER